ncbi:hypothetical protein ACFXKI_09870 [Streptomyces mirabilis]|uniref:hypothetical protein n=1 Tax=Streptomyces mirabilis TaxID=68239 RepID=UPI0036C5D4D8
MTETTDAELAEQLATLRRKMVAAATDETTPEQRAEWKAFDEEMARRIHRARPGVPLHHAFATLETLRAIQRYEAGGVEPAAPVPPSAPTDQSELRDLIAEKLRAAAFECDGKCGLSEQDCYDAHPISFSAMSNGLTHVTGSVTAIADAVLAVLPKPVDRAAVEAAAFKAAANYVRGHSADERYGKASISTALCAVSDELYRWAVEAPAPNRADGETQQHATQPLAAMFEGLHHLLATSSRDWGTYRVDAWLWAVLCGWDCEQDEHDDTCTHGALEETAAMHGWDDATVAKARRYRAAVRAITEPAAVSQPGKEA